MWISQHACSLVTVGGADLGGGHSHMAQKSPLHLPQGTMMLLIGRKYAMNGIALFLCRHEIEARKHLNVEGSPVFNVHGR